MKITCDYCKNPIYKAESKIKRSKHNFCSRECSISYRKEHGYITKRKNDFSSLSKIKLLAELKKRSSLKTSNTYNNCEEKQISKTTANECKITR